MLTIPNCLAFILSSYLLRACIDPLEAAQKPKPWGKEDKRPRASHLTYQKRTAKPVLDYKGRGIADGEREKKEREKGKYTEREVGRKANAEKCGMQDVRQKGKQFLNSRAVGVVGLKRAAKILFKPLTSSSDHYQPRNETWTF